MEGAAPSRKEGRVPRISSSFSGIVATFPGIPKISLKGLGEYYEEEEESSWQEEESDGIKFFPSPVWESQGTGCSSLSQSNQPTSHQSERSLLAIMQKMTQIMANIQPASSSEATRLHL
ncbi:hypothetical protein O181_061245 [Austropuccinia psidii MF-1]|uniref:Uncharacterized protein n=1 Tax=Austropuccinia psidii MF-1 TaxID=1389203 RepID=A0A9Q3I0B1_9BASI|nr:hypothetical protein [Austropuccinia psidii MF-1]